MRRWTRPWPAEPDRAILSNVWTTSTTQSFDMLVRPCPRPMGDVAFAGAIEPCTLWIRARESGISLWRWRRQGHNSPPMARYGLKDTGSTPVAPRYYSPGLPISPTTRNPEGFLHVSRTRWLASSTHGEDTPVITRRKDVALLDL